MTQLTMGVFSNRTDAETAIQDLEKAGYNPQEISIVVKDQEVAQQMHSNTGASVAEGMASGITTGGVIGGIAGLLVGVGVLTIPGLGALFIAGPIAAALGLTGAAATTTSGAITGALAGGVVGGLIGLGVPKETAELYEQEIKAGGVLLAVPTRDGEDHSRDILQNHHADQVRTINLP